MKRDIFTADHELFRESVRQFVDREVLPRREAHREQHQIPAEIWRAAGEKGFLGISVPEEFGGSGLDDFRFNVVLNEEMGRAGMAYGSSFGTHVDVIAPYLIHLTSQEQKKRWLPGFCSGELITAICMTESEAGSDLRGMRTVAERSGDGWVLNGSKTFITNGIGATLLVVAAKTSQRGISLFVVEDGMEGFSRGRRLDKIGQPEADTAELFFEDLHLPDENRIGEADRGMAHMMAHLAQERMSSATLNVAHARFALTDTLEYAKERRAFGQPIGNFQHNRFLIAEMVTELDVAEAFLDRCIAANVRGELDAADAAKAKWWSAHVQNRVLDGCVQLHGGYGYMKEYEVARAWADARVTRIWAGSNEIMKEIIGRSLGFGDMK